MAAKQEITLELIYSTMQTLQYDVSDMRTDVVEIKKSLALLDGRVIGIENDIHEIYDRLVDLEKNTA